LRGINPAEQYDPDHFFRECFIMGKRQKPHFITATDVAEYLKVSEHTVYRWCRQNRIPHFSFNKTYRFDNDEIQRWIESRHHQAEGGQDSEEEVSA
jgi:excisionase family DNA binding protein